MAYELVEQTLPNIVSVTWIMELTHLTLDKMAATLQTIFSDAFS